MKSLLDCNRSLSASVQIVQLERLVHGSRIGVEAGEQSASCLLKSGAGSRNSFADMLSRPAEAALASRLTNLFAKGERNTG